MGKKENLQQLESGGLWWGIKDSVMKAGSEEWVMCRPVSWIHFKLAALQALD